MRYSTTQPNVCHTVIHLANPDHASAFWLMHHTTIALMDALRHGDTALADTLRPINQAAHDRIDTVTAIRFT